MSTTWKIITYRKYKQQKLLKYKNNMDKINDYYLCKKSVFQFLMLTVEFSLLAGSKFLFHFIKSDSDFDRACAYKKTNDVTRSRGTCCIILCETCLYVDTVEWFFYVFIYWILAVWLSHLTQYVVVITSVYKTKN